jgi:hypothetical protein
LLVDAADALIADIERVLVTAIGENNRQSGANLSRWVFPNAPLSLRLQVCKQKFDDRA